MTVYVKSAYLREEIDREARCWYQLISDANVEELHEFAARIDLPRTCFYAGQQYGDEAPPVWRGHYNLTAERRTAALQAGAEPISLSEFVELVKRFQATAKEATG